MTTPYTCFRDRLPRLHPMASLPVSEGDVLVHAPGFEGRTFGVFNAFAGATD